MTSTIDRGTGPADARRGSGSAPGSAASVVSQESSNEYTFRSKTELVLVNVTVRDKNGNPVRDLKREDFTVLEDNKPQQVVSFDLENTDAVLPPPQPKRHCFAPLSRQARCCIRRSPPGP